METLSQLPHSGQSVGVINIGGAVGRDNANKMGSLLVTSLIRLRQGIEVRILHRH